MAVVTIQQSVAALYVAVFNRAPDAAGLNAWTAVITSGQQTFAQVAAGFAAHEVFTTGIGTLSNTDFVAALYQNILGSAGDAGGIANWSNQLNAGMSKADVAALFVQAALTVDIPAMLAAGSLTAAEAAAATVRQQTLTNKADTGIYFANTLGAASNLNPNTVSSSKAGLEADPIYNASKAAIANVTDSVASVTAAKDAIAVAAGSSNPAQALLGGTFTLTTGADTFVGGSSADVFNALTINADGADASTLTGFDSIDGGAGNDTLNIYTDTDATGTAGNKTFPSTVTVKNVETINYKNAGATAGADIDASKFVGATAINQIGTAAADVINLAAGTTAGFNGADLADLSVDGAATATSAAIALTGVKGDVNNVVKLAVSGAALNAVNVSGSIAQHTTGAAAASLALDVTAGDDTATLTVNSAVATTVSVDVANVKVSTVDASASTGAITYNAATTVANIKTGSGTDTVTLNTALTATAKTASVSTGDGIDTLNILATAAASSAATVTADAGAGNDTINLTINSDITYNVAAGAGDDTVVIAGTVKTTDKIDGGAGTDTVSLALAAPKTLVADDYIVFNKVLTNFETLKLTGSAATMDASQLGAGYTTIDLANGSLITKVGAQALIAHGALTATTAGTDISATPKVYAGTLNITDKATGIVTAYADKVALTVAPTTDNDGAVDNTAVTLTGDLKSAAVALSAATDTNGTAADTTDDVLDTSSVSVTTVKAGALENLASLTLSGNGAATVIVGDTKLVSVDASGLNSVDVAGKAAAGLTYNSSNSAAETIKLGAGIDHVTLGASTYGNADVVTGLNLVASAADAKEIDVTKSDTLFVGGIDSASIIIKFTTTQTDLSLALKDAAAFSADNNGADLVFQQGGNTYVFHDAGGSSGAGNGLIDGTDTVVQLTGQVNLDLLSSALHNVA